MYGTRTRRALVVGAGIGGLAAAIALRRAGLEVRVFERTAAIREIGAGLSLWANAIRALEWLGVADAIRRESVPYEIGGLRAFDGSVISDVAAADLTRRLGTPVIVLHRADLHAALLAALPGDAVQLDAACTGIEEDAAGVAVKLADGRVEAGDLVVGADGLHSVVRAALHGPKPPRYAGCTAWRAVVDFRDAVRATETWGHGRLFGQIPISGGRVYWYAARTTPQGGTSPDPTRELLDLFRGWHAPIEALVRAAPASGILRTDLFDRKPLRQWGRGRVTLVGDAAHPMTPFLGQGGCQAIEDAVVLGDRLARSRDVASALRAYEAERVRRANAFVVRSRRAGQLARLRNPLLVWLRNAALRRIPPALQARQLARMIDFKPPEA